VRTLFCRRLNLNDSRVPSSGGDENGLRVPDTHGLQLLLGVFGTGGGSSSANVAGGWHGQVDRRGTDLSHLAVRRGSGVLLQTRGTGGRWRL